MNNLLLGKICCLIAILRLHDKIAVFFMHLRIVHVCKKGRANLASFYMQDSPMTLPFPAESDMC